MTRVLVLGSSGMLGSMVIQRLSREPGLTVVATSRKREVADEQSVKVAARSTQSVYFDAEAGEAPSLQGFEWAINCIGLIKQRIGESAADVRRAVEVNALFPHKLADAAERANCHVIQIATDCVFSGDAGPYSESSPHDAIDVYGKTKSLGEVRSSSFLHLRCSIIGPELAVPGASLMAWLLGQERGAQVSGFSNHYWNGVTTLQFANLCLGLIRSSRTVAPGGRPTHVVPADYVSKADLLRLIARYFQRPDLGIRNTVMQPSIDRRLITQRPVGNVELWRAAGYDRQQSIEEMIAELAAYLSQS